MMYKKLHKLYKAEVEYDNEWDPVTLYFKNRNDAIDYLTRIEADSDSDDYSVFTDLNPVIADIDINNISDSIKADHIVRTFGNDSIRFDDSCRWFFEDKLNTYDYLKLYSNMCDHDIMNYATYENFYAYENNENGFKNYLEDEASARYYTVEELKEDEEAFEEVLKDWEDLEVIGNYKFSFIL